ncbi:MAG: SRPBCC domain-containing protein [Bacteroidota bacterium]
MVVTFGLLLALTLSYIETDIYVLTINSVNMETTEKSPVLQKTIEIEKTFHLPLATVWLAWTDPEAFKKWWGPKTFICTFCRIDLREGGKYLNNMKGNGQEMFGTGVYREILPQKKLVMTDSFSDSEGNIIPPPKEMTGEWAKELIITVELSADGNKTLMKFTHEGIPVEQHDDCVIGWQQSFNKLEQNLKT